MIINLSASLKSFSQLASFRLSQNNFDPKPPSLEQLFPYHHVMERNIEMTDDVG
jgi:hypothetical protein